MSVTVQYDAITAGAIPAYANTPAYAIAGYLDGYWPSYWPLVARFPQARHLSLTVHGGIQADGCDCETGDLTVPAAVAWAKWMIQAGRYLPVIYMQLSNVMPIINGLRAAGIDREQVRLWSAHVDQGKHICNPHDCGEFGLDTTVDATQWEFSLGGLNVDVTECAPRMWTPPQPPAPADSMHYSRYPNIEWPRRLADGKTGQTRERGACMLYDHLRRRWYLHEPRLHTLRQELTYLHARVEYVATHDLESGRSLKHAVWGQDWRQWREERLRIRMSGGVVHPE